MGLGRAFRAQPETERYLNHVADKFELRRDIRFGSRVASAYWDEAGRQWQGNRLSNTNRLNH